MYVQMQCYYSLPIFTLRALSSPQVLAEQLTLSQPGEQIMPTTELRAPPDLRREVSDGLEYLKCKT